MRILMSSAGLGSHCCRVVRKHVPKETVERRKKAYSDHIRCDVTDTTSPVLRGVVKDVVDTNLVVLLGQSVQVLLEQNILSGDIGEDKIDFGLVASSATTDDSTDDLKHRCDTSTAGNHTKVAYHVGLVDESTLGALDANGLANNKGRHELGDVALGVALDQEIEVTGLVVAGDGRVGAHDLLDLAVLLRKDGANGDVLADGEAEDRLRGGKLEAVAAMARICQSRLIEY